MAGESQGCRYKSIQAWLKYASQDSAWSGERIRRLLTAEMVLGRQAFLLECLT